MNSVWNITLAVMVSFIMSAALNFGLSYVSRDSGTITVGPSDAIQGKTYLPVAISNFSESPLDDIVLSVPSSVASSELISSDSIRVTDEPNNAATVDRKQISISGIGHNRVVMLQIPLANQDQIADVEVMNAKQKKLTVMPVKDISYPVTRVLLAALLAAIVYAFIFALFMMWEYSNQIEMDANLQEVKERLATVEKRGVERENAMREITSTLNRTKIVLLARMSDYARELRFWRDTMRKVLYGLTGGKEAGEELVKHVSQSLKSYTTIASADADTDFELMKVLGGLIFRYELENKKVSEGGS